ncbi:MAG: hypothetical protein KTV68_05485 [Acidimicrobiia bacterium]|nr:hypothetical protein [Acidimicrobiia bacterium]MCY4432901.1 hypothetical protein [bacterium]
MGSGSSTPRTRSDIFSKAQTLTTAWDDPYITAASAVSVNTDSGEITRPAMTLQRLFGGNHTIYVIQPLGTASRFAVLFGGLLDDRQGDLVVRLVAAEAVEEP